MEDLKELIEKRFDEQAKFIDRRIAEMSAELAASVELEEMNDQSMQDKLLEVSNMLSEITQEKLHKSIDASDVALEYIIDTTSKASGNIMDAADRLEKLVFESDTEGYVNVDNFKEYIAEIYSACSFQDLVGQKAMKVRNNLTSLDSLVDGSIEDMDELHNEDDDTGEATDQNAIDKMFE